jgi:hypothetical protein
MTDSTRALLARLRARADECGTPSTGGRHLCTKDEFLRLLAVVEAAQVLLKHERGGCNHYPQGWTMLRAALAALGGSDHAN